jgi:hypothetical protein
LTKTDMDDKLLEQVEKALITRWLKDHLTLNIFRQN